MKTAIFYTSKHGTTEKVAQIIKNQIGENNAQLFNLKTDSIPDINIFDNVIIGGSIHAGQIQKRLRDFCHHHETILSSKRVALFVCSMYEGETAETQLKNAFPELLRKQAVCCTLAGGEFLFEKMNMFERLIVRKVTGVKENKSSINENAISALVNAIKQKV